EDGIRDKLVTGVQTCALPIYFFGGFGPFPQTIGDAQSVVLFDGTYMQANCCTKQEALLDPKTLTWAATGRGKFDIHDEEGWTLQIGRASCRERVERAGGDVSG